MTYSVELRTVTPQGHPDKPLPSRRNVKYLDDNDDVGTLTFDYLIDGVRSAALAKGRDEFVELAVLVDGEELPNSRFTILDWKGSDNSNDEKPFRTYNCTSYLDRLDEVLILAEDDPHMREDVLTDAERRQYQEAKEEWMAQQIREAIDRAKDRAKTHNDKIRDRRNKSESGGTHGDVSTAGLNHWGRHAINWAQGQISNRSQDWYHMCQSFVRQSFGLPGIYSTADEAWRAGLKRGNTPFNDTPAGVPVYWGPNHVALSIGGGDCISTDVLRAGWPDVVPISSLSNGVHWSLSYRGWSPEVSGRRIFP